MSIGILRCYCSSLYRTGTVRYSWLMLLVIGGLLLGAQPAAADSPGNLCIKEETGLNNPACTANDVRVGSMELIFGPFGL